MNPARTRKAADESESREFLLALLPIEWVKLKERPDHGGYFTTWHADHANAADGSQVASSPDAVVDNPGERDNPTSCFHVRGGLGIGRQPIRIDSRDPRPGVTESCSGIGVLNRLRPIFPYLRFGQGTAPETASTAEIGPLRVLLDHSTVKTAVIHA